MVAFPQSWRTQRTWIDRVRTSETEVLASTFNSSSDVRARDPTFQPVDVSEVLGLIQEDEASAGLTCGFRMQAIRLHGGEEPIGYFHFREAPPRAEVVGLTMFVIRPEFRGRGFGREVTDGLFMHLSKNPENHVAWTRVYLKNHRTFKFWTALGFTRIAEHKGDQVHDDGDGHVSVIRERLLDSDTE